MNFTQLSADVAQCNFCKKEVPKRKQCVHGKKPKNCGGLCGAAHLREHAEVCEGRQNHVRGMTVLGLQHSQTRKQSINKKQREMDLKKRQKAWGQS